MPEPEKPKRRIDVAISIAIITAIGSIIVAVIAISPLLGSFFHPAVISPTPTSIPYARIQSLEVFKEGNIITTFEPGESITLTTGGNLVLRVNVISNTALNDLIFNWEFCNQVNGISGYGVIEVPYTLSGLDCIQIKIEHEGASLDVARFFANAVTANTPIVTPFPTYTETPIVIVTPNATLTLQAGFEESNRQHQQFVKANMAYIVPKEMQVGEEFIVELILKPGASQEDLRTEIAILSGLPTSLAQPGTLVAEGGAVNVVPKEVEITPLMKAVLQTEDSTIFTVLPLQDTDIQVISLTESAKWRWLLTAKKDGKGTLALIMSRLIQYDGEDYWHEVESRTDTIVIKVTPLQRVQLWDWGKSIGWLLVTVFTLILIPLFLDWIRKRRKDKTKRKYTPLQEYLTALPKEVSEITLTFSKVEEIIQAKLPASAEKDEWWTRETKSSRVQADAWHSAGWIVLHLDIANQKVTFARKKL